MMNSMKGRNKNQSAFVQPPPPVQIGKASAIDQTKFNDGTQQESLCFRTAATPGSDREGVRY